MNVPVGSVWRSKKSNDDAFAIIVVKVKDGIITAVSKSNPLGDKSLLKFSIKRLNKNYVIESNDNENEV